MIEAKKPGRIRSPANSRPRAPAWSIMSWMGFRTVGSMTTIRLEKAASPNAHPAVTPTRDHASRSSGSRSRTGGPAAPVAAAMSAPAEFPPQIPAGEERDRGAPQAEPHQQQHNEGGNIHPPAGHEGTRRPVGGERRDPAQGSEEG